MQLPTTDQLEALEPNADLPAIMGQFLNDVSLDDIVAELVQNDLDQDARRTEIIFERDHLIVRGDGRPVDEDGWPRLGTVVGAGGSVAPKADGIGTKNLGLRTLFLLGNFIRVRSAGRSSLLVVSRDNQTMDPRCQPEPSVDPDAPARGCVVEVHYRTRPVRPAFVGSELPTLEPLSPAALAEMFEAAVVAASRRFLGCVAPGIRRKYELVLRHHELGEHHFVYEVLPRAKPLTFRRRCRHVFPGGGSQERREQGVGFSAPLPAAGGRVPRFFRLPRKRVRLELSWAIDRKGRVLPEVGHLRYPLEYSNLRTGTSVTYSAPFVSDRARHDLASGRAAWNGEFMAACRGRLPRAMRDVAMVHHGPGAMDLLRAADCDPAEECLSLLSDCIDLGALPVKRRGRSVRGWPEANVPRLPTALASPGRYSQAVASWLPSHVTQVDSRAPQWVLNWLASEADDPRWRVVSESDLLDLFRPDDQGRPCGWRSASEWRRFLKHTKRVRDLLRLLVRVPANARRWWSGEGLFLPDEGADPGRCNSLVQASRAPPEIPGVAQPVLLHSDLVGLAALRCAPFNVAAFDESQHVSQLDGDDLDDAEKSRLFEWMLRRIDALSSGALRQLGSERVWRASDGTFVTFVDLCEPKSPIERRILAPTLYRPDRRLLRIKRVCGTRGRPALRLSRQADTAHVHAWYERQAEQESAESDEGLAALESEMLELSRLRHLRRAVAELGATHQTKSDAGCRRPVRELHRDAVGVRLGLLRRDRVSRLVLADLAELLGARDTASPDAIARALSDAPSASLLEARLSALFAAPNNEEDIARLRREAIVGDGTDLVAPERLALVRKNAPDFWGRWRRPVSQTMFSATARELLSQLGAVGTNPTRAQTIAFFDWLRGGDEARRVLHRKQVLLHWLRNSNGPSTWAEHEPGIPCLPVILEGQFGLLPYPQWKRARRPDFPELAAALAADRSRVPLVVPAPEGWASSMDSLLRGAVPGLRETARVVGSPLVLGPGERSEQCETALASLARSAVRKRLVRCLEELGVGARPLVSSWWARVEGYRVVRRAERLTEKYKVGAHRAVDVSVRHALDPTVGTFWVACEPQGELPAFHEALARLVYRNVPTPLEAMALARAMLEAESPGRSVAWFEFTDADPISEGVEEFGDDENVDDSESGGSHDGTAHNPLVPDPEANVPTDDEFTDDPPGSSPGGGAGGGNLPGGAGGKTGRKPKSGLDGSSGRPPDELEAAHRENLLRSYAGHCQLCLGGAEPLELAPPGTYVETFELRRKLMEAHHVVFYSEDGERHAGNLLVLCVLCHRNIGDELPPDGVTEALRRVQRVARSFGIDGRERSVEGLTAAVDTPSGRRTLFFTQKHAEYWLSRSVGDATAADGRV